MKETTTILGKDFVVKTDCYPYEETKKILAELTDWWEYDARKNNIGKTNYSLDHSLKNSIASSLDTKLKDGNFSFVYYKDQVFAYAGCQVVGKEVLLHRYTNSPLNDYALFGAGTTALIPLQIKWAKEQGFDYYKVSFNEHNHKIYRSLLIDWYARGPTLKNYELGMKLMSKFEFHGLSEINFAKQWTISLDLNRPDINDFLPKESENGCTIPASNWSKEGMREYSTILDSSFVVKTDHYPYKQSKKILAKLESWWNQDSRKEYVGRDNFSLNASIPNSLGSSLNNKLKNGNFSFVYQNGEIIAYGGFYASGKEVWLHRYTNNPDNPQELFGAGTTALIPLQIKWAKEQGFDYYKVSFNNDNYRVYNALKNGWFARGPAIEEYKTGATLFSKFEFLGSMMVNNVEQWVISLDLNRPDIDDFILL